MLSPINYLKLNPSFFIMVLKFSSFLKSTILIILYSSFSLCRKLRLNFIFLLLAEYFRLLGTFLLNRNYELNFYFLSFSVIKLLNEFF